MAKKVQEYKGEKITVSFDPERCIHAANCVHGLPNVFKANVKGPWINPDEADADELAELIHTCPSGALTYRRGDDAAEEAAPEINSITMVADGPLNVHADMEINGKPEPSFRATLCRCGASENKPYCDGSHTEAGFKDAGMPEQGDLDETIIHGKLAITAVPDGPLMFMGGCIVQNANGDVVAYSNKGALCRCGASGNKPNCDGSHLASGFKTE